MAKYGATALMNRVGHAFFKQRMRETNAIFGGEVTGHYYFSDNFYADNGFIPALLMLELMDSVPAKLAQIAAKYSDGHQYNLDGISVEYPDWHFNVRPSNTEPLLRLNLEAKTAEMMASKRDEVIGLIRA
ncbi:MAG: hypothetical protein PVSMB1_10370 [Gemmatimonadaceae bacterium]